MIDAVTNVKNVAGDAAALRVAADTKAAEAKPADTAKPQEQEKETLKKADVAPISPRMRPDFLSGTIITEFVGDNGQVTQQSPTTAALAYLRIGLDANGQHKDDGTTSAPKANAVVA